MARVIDRLSVARVEKAGPGMHADGGGLYLLVSKTGAKSWVFRYVIAGKQHYAGLGAVHAFKLAEARERARRGRQQLFDGIDPLASKRQARQAAAVAIVKATSFEQAAKAYIRSHRAAWKSPKSLAAWEHTLQDFAYPIIGKLPAADIDTDLIGKVLEQPIGDTTLWLARPETANRLRGRLEMVLDYAKVKGWRQDENPARWRGHLDHLLPARQAVAKTVHHPALPYAEVTAFVAELRGREGLAARALEFAILTAARTGEVIGATRPEVDLEGRLWTIPAERMKAGREHRVPISEAASAILAALPQTGERLFPVSNMALLMLLRRMGRADLTVHGFRSTFSDWAAEQTNAPSEVREMALAHTVSDKVEAAYRRGDLFDKRRQLADSWARFCTAPAAAAEVVPLRRAQQ